MVSEIQVAADRNYRIVGLTHRNTVVLQKPWKMGGAPGFYQWDSGDKPSAYGTWGLMPGERAVLRRGLTTAGNDRIHPQGEVTEVIEWSAKS